MIGFKEQVWTKKEWPPCGFNAGDANLYRYVGNSPTNAVDPSGQQEEKPIRAEFDEQSGVPAGYFVWAFKAPDLPKDFNVYTYVDMEWEVKKCKDDPDKPRKGSYRFWLEGGIESLSEATFNLWPYHGSHRSLNKDKRGAWPVFENNKQHEDYLKKSVDATNTCGTLTIRLVYRGYKEKATEKFNPKYPGEKGGPFEVPTLSPDPNPNIKGEFLLAPNRQRTYFRKKNPWLAEKPKIWDAKPVWEHVIELTYTWDWSSKDFGKYAVKQTGQQATSGTTLYQPPKK